MQNMLPPGSAGMTRMRPPQWLKRITRDYKIYAVRSSSLAASATGQNVSIAFDHTGYIFAIGATATIATFGASGATAAVGYRDTFTILFKKSNSEVLVTSQVAATSLFGLYTGPLELVRPWPISRSNAVIATVDNLNANTAITIELVYHLAVTQVGTDQ